MVLFANVAGAALKKTDFTPHATDALAGKASITEVRKSPTAVSIFAILEFKSVNSPCTWAICALNAPTFAESWVRRSTTVEIDGPSLISV
jgi:hypothetical protein